MEADNVLDPLNLIWVMPAEGSEGCLRAVGLLPLADGFLITECDDSLVVALTARNRGTSHSKGGER